MGGGHRNLKDLQKRNTYVTKPMSLYASLNSSCLIVADRTCFKQNLIASEHLTDSHWLDFGET